jgi:hypothetical protein
MNIYSYIVFVSFLVPTKINEICESIGTGWHY